MTSGTQDRLAAREQLLCGIYADVLGVELVLPDDGFFDAGGDSVLALQVVARAREAGLELSVRDLFDHQSASQLAPMVTDAAQTGAGAAAGTAAGEVDPAAAAPALSRERLDELGLDDLQFDEFDEFDGIDGIDGIELDEGSGQPWDDETGWETGR